MVPSPIFKAIGRNHRVYGGGVTRAGEDADQPKLPFVYDREVCLQVISEIREGVIILELTGSLVQLPVLQALKGNTYRIRSIAFASLWNGGLRRRVGSLRGIGVLRPGQGRHGHPPIVRILKGNSNTCAVPERIESRERLESVEAEMQHEVVNKSW